MQCNMAIYKTYVTHALIKSVSGILPYDLYQGAIHTELSSVSMFPAALDMFGYTYTSINVAEKLERYSPLATI